MEIRTAPTVDYAAKRDVRAYGGLVRGINTAAVQTTGAAILPKVLGRLGLGVSTGFAVYDTVMAARATGLSAHTRETAARGTGGVAGAFFGAKYGALAGGVIGSAIVPGAGTVVGSIIGGVAGGVLGGIAGSELLGRFERGFEGLLG